MEVWGTLIEIFITFPLSAAGEWTVGLGGSWEAREEVRWSLDERRWWPGPGWWLWDVGMWMDHI